MNFKTKTLILGLIMIGGMALSQAKATDPDVHARQVLMDTNGGAMKTLGDMAKGDVAFDATAAAAAKAQLITDAGNIPAAFEKNATDPETQAKPEIWANMDDFKAHAAALGKAATALDTTSLDTLKAGLGDVGGACGACHKAYHS